MVVIKTHSCNFSCLTRDFVRFLEYFSILLLATVMQLLLFDMCTH